MTLRKFEPTHPCCGGVGCRNCKNGGSNQYKITISGIVDWMGQWTYNGPTTPYCLSGACEGLNGDYIVGPTQTYSWDYDSIQRCMWYDNGDQKFTCKTGQAPLDVGARLIVGRNENDGHSDPMLWYIAAEIYDYRWATVIPNVGDNLLDCGFNALELPFEIDWSDGWSGCVATGSTAVVSVYTPSSRGIIARKKLSPLLQKFIADRKANPTTRKRCCGGFHPTPTPTEILKKLR